MGREKLSGENLRDHEVTLGSILELLKGRARDNRLMKTVPQVRTEEYERVQLSIEFGLLEGNKERVSG